MSIHQSELHRQASHYAAIKAKLYGRPANTNIKTKPKQDDPVVEVKPLKARQLPMWELGDVHFDAHVIRYREWVRAMDEIRALRTEGTVTIYPSGFIIPEKKKPVKEIIEEVLRDYPGMSFDLVTGPRRARKIVEARYACMRAVHNERPDMSFPQIGRIFNRDHTVIIYAVGKLKSRKPSRSAAPSDYAE